MQTTADTDTLLALVNRGWKASGGQLWHPILQRFRPVPMPYDSTRDRERASRRLKVLSAEVALLDGDPTEPTPAPMVSAVEVGGRLPTAEQVRNIEAALSKAPRAVISRWRSAGGRCELVAGRNATIHPHFSHRPIEASGWCDAWGGRLLAVAADASRPERTALHELGHAVDLFDVPHPWQYSSTPEWQELSNRPFGWYKLDHHLESNAAELFAESFSRFCFSAEDRGGLTNAVKLYLEKVIQEFAGP